MMKIHQPFDLTYVTVDSIAEGVGSSQIRPLISLLSKQDLKINLISFEKSAPNTDLVAHFESLGVIWNAQSFGIKGVVGGLERLNVLRREIQSTKSIHARSDIPAVSAIFSMEAPVIWDVRSLWADQKISIQDNLINSSLYRVYRRLESIAASKSSGMSTLTSAVIPVLEQRHKRLPQYRTVVPTIVDLDRFELNEEFPTNVKALFSGTFNDYYDLGLSNLFMAELQKSISLEIHWARPLEAHKSHIGVGESKVFSLAQTSMSEIIPNYSFGVSVCKMDSGPSLTASMPTKIAEFLACGRPIVTNKGLGDMDKFISEFDAGVILDGSEENLKLGVTKLLDLLADSETPKRCRALAEKYFSLQVGVDKYIDLYSQILI